MKRLFLVLLGLVTILGQTILAQGQSEMILSPGQSRTLECPPGSLLEFSARIDFDQAAGAAALLEVTANGKPLGPLRNKSPRFTIKDGRSFPYMGPDGLVYLFFSPNFSDNNQPNCPYYVTTDRGQAYRYAWTLPTGSGGPVTVRLRHVAIHAGKKLMDPIVLRMGGNSPVSGTTVTAPVTPAVDTPPGKQSPGKQSGATVTVTPPPDSSEARTPAQQVKACEANLKYLATGCEYWANNHQGSYPRYLSALKTKYIQSVPTCPATGTDTYSATYEATRKNGDHFTIHCEGHNHQAAGLEANLPAYDSETGLVKSR